MKRHTFVHGNVEYSLVARGVEENLDRALACVKALVKRADFAMAGIVEAHDVVVTIRAQWKGD